MKTWCLRMTLEVLRMPFLEMASLKDCGHRKKGLWMLNMQGKWKCLPLSQIQTMSVTMLSQNEFSNALQYLRLNFQLKLVELVISNCVHYLFIVCLCGLVHTTPCM